MKKSLLLSLALGLAGATVTQAADLYITGSTAFRVNVYDACFKLFDTAPATNANPAIATLAFGTSATGGNYPQAAGADDKNTQWVMTGTVTGTIPAMGATPLTIHALFTGSVSGISDTESGNPITFIKIDGTTTNNPPTISFSDVASTATPYSVGNTSNFKEEKVAVQPFVIAKSNGGGSMTNVTDLTTEQLQNIIKIGRIRQSAFSHNPADVGNFVYLINRTQDSGTRLSALREVNYIYNSPVNVYIYDFTNATFFTPTTLTPYTIGNANAGVVGSPGNNFANTNWGPGYVAGSDVSKELGYVTNNTAIAYLSFADAKGITSTNWGQVISFNGVWPTGDGSALTIPQHAVTNIDFTPVMYGTYPFWNYEYLIEPLAVESESLQNLTTAQLGDGNSPGTILGVLNHVATTGSPTPLVGSIDNEILLSKTNSIGNTAIRLIDMHASRATVGGLITP